MRQKSYTKTPVTSDEAACFGSFGRHREIRQFTCQTEKRSEWDWLQPVNRLKNSQAKSKVIILLTDSVNNWDLLIREWLLILQKNTE